MSSESIRIFQKFVIWVWVQLGTVISIWLIFLFWVRYQYLLPGIPEDKTPPPMATYVGFQTLAINPCAYLVTSSLCYVCFALAVDSLISYLFNQP